MASRMVTEDYFNIILVGDKGVGKTTLLNRFGQSEGAVMATHVDNKEVKACFWDALAPSLSGYKDKLIGKADGFLIIYDVTKKSSFDNIIGWILKMNLASFSPHRLMMVIANKSDLEGQRVVSKERGEEFACELGAVAFREMSTVNYNKDPFLWMLWAVSLRRKFPNRVVFLEKLRKEEERKSGKKTQS